MERDHLMSIAKERRNADLARRVFGDHFSNVGPEEFVKLYAPDAVVYEYGLPGSPVMRGREELLAFLSQMASGFPGATYDPELVLPSGDHVVVVWRWKGSLSADFMGVKAASQKIDLPGIMIYEFGEDGLVKTERVWWNFHEFLSQLGALPDGLDIPTAAGT